jgi:hypothetical protein
MVTVFLSTGAGTGRDSRFQHSRVFSDVLSDENRRGNVDGEDDGCCEKVFLEPEPETFGFRCCCLWCGGLYGEETARGSRFRTRVRSRGYFPDPEVQRVVTTPRRMF